MNVIKARTPPQRWSLAPRALHSGLSKQISPSPCAHLPTFQKQVSSTSHRDVLGLGLCCRVRYKGRGSLNSAGLVSSRSRPHQPGLRALSQSLQLGPPAQCWEDLGEVHGRKVWRMHYKLSAVATLGSGTGGRVKLEVEEETKGLPLRPKPHQ